MVPPSGGVPHLLLRKTRSAGRYRETRLGTLILSHRAYLPLAPPRSWILADHTEDSASTHSQVFAAGGRPLHAHPSLVRRGSVDTVLGQAASTSDTLTGSFETVLPPPRMLFVCAERTPPFAFGAGETFSRLFSLAVRFDSLRPHSTHRRKRCECYLEPAFSRCSWCFQLARRAPARPFLSLRLQRARGLPRRPACVIKPQTAG